MPSNHKTIKQESDLIRTEQVTMNDQPITFKADARDRSLNLQNGTEDNPYQKYILL